MNERTAKQNFSAMGMAIFIFLVLVSALQIGISMLVNYLVGAGDYPTWAFWLVTFVPMYCVGLPILYVLMKRIPREDLVETETFTFGRWLKCFVIAIFLMVVGSIIGVIVGNIFGIFGINTSAAVDTILSQSSILGNIVLAIIAPIVEEFIFRKWLIDRMHIYGGRVAVVTTALMFGLFHGNFSQFFYAFLLGLVFGYVYYKSGNVLYTILMHMIVNFCGGVIAPMLLSGIDLTDPVAMMANPKIYGLVAYEICMYGAAIVGLVLFLKNRKNITYAEERLQLPEEEKVKTPWGNLGMILFLVGCIALFIYGMVASML